MNSFILSNTLLIKSIPAGVCVLSLVYGIFKEQHLMSGIEKSNSEGLIHLQVCLLKPWYLLQVCRWYLNAFDAVSD